MMNRNALTYGTNANHNALTYGLKKNLSTFGIKG